jgi:NADPH2:quinone reductase
VTWPSRTVYTEHRAQLEAAAADLFDAIQRSILDVGPSRTYGLDDIVTAHHDLEGRMITGAGIIIP